MMTMMTKTDNGMWTVDRKCFGSYVTLYFNLVVKKKIPIFAYPETQNHRPRNPRGHPSIIGDKNEKQHSASHQFSPHSEWSRTSYLLQHFLFFFFLIVAIAVRPLISFLRIHQSRPSACFEGRKAHLLASERASVRDSPFSKRERRYFILN